MNYPSRILSMLALVFCQTITAQTSKEAVQDQIKDPEHANQRIAALRLFAPSFQLDAKIVSELMAGDYREIDSLAANTKVQDLWVMFAFVKAGNPFYDELTRKHGYTETSQQKKDQKSELTKVFVDRVLPYLRAKMSSIPGHAKFLGDRIDELANYEDGNDREFFIKLLGELGSMESIQQLARFLNDDRNPGLRKYLDKGGPDSGVGGPISNASLVPASLHLALGKDSPVNPDAHFFNTPDKRQIFTNWWRSDAAQPYRDWNYADGYTLPGTRDTKVEKSQKQPTALNERTESSLIYYVAGIVGLLLSVWLSSRRLSRRN